MANPKFVYCLSAEYMLECQRDEWSDSGLEWWVLDYDVHQGMQRLSRDLNAIYRQAPALRGLDSSPTGFSWNDANDAPGNTLSFLRFPAASDDRPDGAEVVACIANFCATPHLKYRPGLPKAGR